MKTESASSSTSSNPHLAKTKNGLNAPSSASTTVTEAPVAQSSWETTCTSSSSVTRSSLQTPNKLWETGLQLLRKSTSSCATKELARISKTSPAHALSWCSSWALRASSQTWATHAHCWVAIEVLRFSRLAEITSPRMSLRSRGWSWTGVRSITGRLLHRQTAATLMLL